ncbi:MAG: hypothetical protein AAGF95_15405 [Chloroflexota bacterium]
MSYVDSQADRIWLCCDGGICDFNGRWMTTLPFHNETVVTGVATANRVAVVVNQHTIWERCSNDWHELASSELKINALLYTREGQLLVAMEQGRLARVQDNVIVPNEHFDAMPTRIHWTTPWGGVPNVHSLTESSNGVIYGAVHTGWMVRSHDGGASWTQIANGLHMDVSTFVCHPHEPETLIVSTGDGVFVSEDGGEQFERRWHDRSMHYLRGIAVLNEQDIWLVSAHPNAKRDAGTILYRSEDRGATWKPCEGIPQSGVGHINTILSLDSGCTIALAHSHTFITTDYGESWTVREQILPARYFDPKRSFLCPILYGLILESV